MELLFSCQGWKMTHHATTSQTCRSSGLQGVWCWPSSLAFKIVLTHFCVLVQDVLRDMLCTRYDGITPDKKALVTSLLLGRLEPICKFQTAWMMRLQGNQMYRTITLAVSCINSMSINRLPMCCKTFDAHIICYKDSSLLEGRPILGAWIHNLFLKCIFF